MPITQSRTFVIVPIILLVALSACNTSPQPESKVSGPAPNCQDRIETEIRIGQLGLKNETVGKAQVAALIFTSDENTLLVAYAFDEPAAVGQLAQIQIIDHRVIRTVPLGRLTVGLTRFTEDTELILSAAPKACPFNAALDEACWDVRVWNTVDGKTMEMPEGTNTNLRDIAVSGDRKWLLKTELVNTITSFDTQAQGESFAESREGVHREVVIGSLSQKGNLVGLGIKDEPYRGGTAIGLVRLEQWNGQRLEPIVRQGWRFGSNDLTGDAMQLDGVPLRLVFDSADRWLAAQTLNSIYLFYIPSLGEWNRRANFPRSSLGVLRFNPVGSLLSGGHASGIRVLSVPDLKVTLDKLSAQVSAIAFSPDGCLLAWGDTEGTVHIINTPMP